MTKFEKMVDSLITQNMPLTFEKIPAMLVEAAQRGYNLRAIEEWEAEK